MTSETQPPHPETQPPHSDAQPSKGTIRVLQLYPREMNIYGDWGGNAWY